MREEAVFAEQKKRVTEQLGAAVFAAVGLMVRQYMGAPTMMNEGPDSAAALWDEGVEIERGEAEGSFDMERYLQLKEAAAERGDRFEARETVHSAREETSRAAAADAKQERSVSGAAPEDGAGWHDAAGAQSGAEESGLRAAREVSEAVEREARRYDSGFYLY